MRHTRTLLPLGFAAALLVSACSSDSDSSSDTNADSTVATITDETTDESATESTTETTEATTGETTADSATDEDPEVTEASTADSGSDSEGGEDLYRINFDGEPTEGTLDAGTVGAESSTRSVSLDNGDFEVVSQTDLVDPGAASLDGMVAGTQQSVGGDEPVVETVSLNGWEARQWSFTFEQAGLEGTYYAVGGVVDDKLLQVAYVDGGSDNQAEAEAFLESLEVLVEGPG